MADASTIYPSHLHEYLQAELPQAAGHYYQVDYGQGPRLLEWDEAAIGQARPTLATVQRWSPSDSVTEFDTSPKPRTQALTPEELAAARASVAQVVDSAVKATNTATLKQSVASLAEAFDAVLARLAGE